MTKHYVQSIKALAQELGNARQTVHEWISKFEDAPRKTAEGYDVEAWRQFKEDNSLAEHRDDSPWRRKMAELQCVKLQREIDIDEGRLIRVEDIEPKLCNWLEALRRGIDSMPHQTSRFLIGLDEEGIRARLQEEADQLLESLGITTVLQCLTPDERKVFDAIGMRSYAQMRGMSVPTETPHPEEKVILAKVGRRFTERILNNPAETNPDGVA